MQTRTCRDCGIPKPIDEFPIADKRGYRGSYCRLCKAKRVAARQHERELVDPEFRRRKQRSAIEATKKRYHTDPVFREKVKERARQK